MIHACEQQVQELLPDLPRPEQKALAALVGGVVLSEQANLSTASAAIPGVAHDASKQRRAQRLLANAQVVVLADCGLSGGPLARLCGEVGWHFLLRVTRGTRVRRADGTVCPVGALVPQPGTRCCLQAVTLLFISRISLVGKTFYDRDGGPC